MSNNIDEKFMKLALKLAEKGIGLTSPNPCVGAVLVKNNKIIGKGYHKKFGGLHAEIEALNSCSEDPKGSSLYVTLEPCAHFGKQPPCSDAIIKAGIKEVIAACEDPDPKVKGKGFLELKKHGIKTQTNILQKQALKLNETYIKSKTKNLPFVALKFAMSLDGKIATNSGDSKWITNEKSRAKTHELRNKYDAVLIGINTVIKDNPLLNVRHISGRDPIKIILDSNLKIPLNSKILKTGKTIIFTTQKANFQKIANLKEKNINIIKFKDKINLKKVLSHLNKLNINSLLVEGGSKINASFFEENLIDKVYAFIAPKLIGGENALTPIGGKGITIMKKIKKLKDVKTTKFKEDVLIEGYL